MKLTIHRSIEADKQFLMDILVTFVESGYSDWCSFVSVERDDDLNVLSFVGHDVEDDEETFAGGLGTVLRGCQHVLDGDFEHEELAGYIMNQDGCNIDAEFADIIMQMGLLGEIVYG